jgi:undecaprenyl-diphosphatase
VTGAREWLAEADRLDKSVYEAIARTRTPLLDRSMRALSRSADYSKLSLAASAALAIAAGPEDAGPRHGVSRPSP